MKFALNRIQDIGKLSRELMNGLSKLTFRDNFEGKEVTLVIPATSEAVIPNTLKFIPKGYIITSQVGNGLVTRSSTEWTQNNIYLYNNGSVEVTLTIQFLK